MFCFKIDRWKTSNGLYKQIKDLTTHSQSLQMHDLEAFLFKNDNKIDYYFCIEYLI